MWFAYPREESWIPLPIHKVKEIQAMNKEGVIPPDLGELAELETKLTAKVFDYENVVGQDSLTRLDERRNSNKKKNKNRNNRNPNQAPQQGSQQRLQGSPNGPVAAPQDGNRPPRPEGNRPEGGRPDGERPQGNNQNRRNKHRRPNQNNQNRPDNPGRPTE